MSQSEKQDHLNQIVQTLIFMGMFMKQTDPNSARAFLGGAVLACRKHGDFGDEVPNLVFEKVFPGEPLPEAVSDDVFETIRKNQQDQ